MKNRHYTRYFLNIKGIKMQLNNLHFNTFYYLDFSLAGDKLVWAGLSIRLPLKSKREP